MYCRCTFEVFMYVNVNSLINRNIRVITVLKIDSLTLYAEGGDWSIFCIVQQSDQSNADFKKKKSI